MNDTHYRWKKSSFTAEQTDCVEIANTWGVVRDSKNRNGPTLTFPSGNLRAFVAGLKTESTD